MIKGKVKKDIISWFLGLFLIPSLILNIYLFQKSQKYNQGIKVIAVFDGDTILLDGKTKLRLRSVDAPELEFCGGPEAKKLLSSLVEGKRIEISEKIIGRWGRPTALVYLNNKLINEKMLASGWARYHSDKTTQKKILQTAFNQAKKDKKGIFSPKCRQIENLDNPDCLIKGNIDKNSGAKKYYFPGCVQYKFTIIEKDIGEQWFCNEAEAKKAGFKRSKTCPQK